MDLHKLNSVNYYLKPFTSQAPSLLFPLQLNPSSMLLFSLVRRHYTNQFYSDVNNALTMQTFFMFPILMPKHNMSNLFVVLARFSSSPPLSLLLHFPRWHICYRPFILVLFNSNDMSVFPPCTGSLFSKYIYLKCVAFPMQVPPFWHSPLWHGSTSVWQFLPV